MKRLLCFVLLLIATPSFAAITVGVSNWNGNVANGTTVSTASMTTQATGSTFVALVQEHANTGSADQATVTDNKGNTWTFGTNTGIFGAGLVGIYYCINCAGGSGHIVTATWTVTASSSAISAVEFLGVGAGTIGSVPTGVLNSSGSPNVPPTVTTAVSGELVVNGFATYGANGQTISDSGSGFAIIVKNQAGTMPNGAISWNVVATSGSAVHDSFTFNTFDYSVGLAISIKPAGAGGSCTHNFWKNNGSFPQPDGSTGSYWNVATGNFSTPDCSTGTFWRQDGAKAAN